MPMSAAEIEGMILDALPGADVEMTDLAGDNNHWAARVTAPQFAGKTRVQQHKLVRVAALETSEKLDIPLRSPGHLLVQYLARNAHEPLERGLPKLVWHTRVGGRHFGGAEEEGPRMRRLQTSNRPSFWPFPFAISMTIASIFTRGSPSTFRRLTTFGAKPLAIASALRLS